MYTLYTPKHKIHCTWIPPIVLNPANVQQNPKPRSATLYILRTSPFKQGKSNLILIYFFNLKSILFVYQKHLKADSLN